ncbi:MAG: Na+/H+ antiporter subunit E [Candidatus Promineifilaceae bacterium]
MLSVNLLLAIAWIVLTGEFTPANFATGFLLGYLMLLWADKGTAADSPASRYLKRVPKIITLVFYFLWTIIVANFRMAKAVLSPLSHLNPAIVAVPLDIQGPIGIMLLANWITLTPGTLSLEIAEDRQTIFIHTFQCTDVDAFRAEIKNDFERRLIEVSA